VRSFHYFEQQKYEDSPKMLIIAGSNLCHAQTHKKSTQTIDKLYFFIRKQFGNFETYF